MKKYIDREALLNRLEESPDTWWKGLGRSWWAHSVILKDNFVRLIREAPTADVVEVKHGYWTAHPASYECSICENEFFVEGYAEDYDAVEDWDLHYCPNCGAKMDGERKKPNE